jgi:hypothetical protein
VSLPLTTTPGQAHELSRTAARHGAATVRPLPRGGLLVEIDRTWATVAVALGPDGRPAWFARAVEPDDEPTDDPAADLGDEQPLPDPVDASGALPRRASCCDSPLRGDDGRCHRCGHAILEQLDLGAAA